MRRDRLAKHLPWPVAAKMQHVGDNLIRRDAEGFNDDVSFAVCGFAGDTMKNGTGRSEWATAGRHKARTSIE